MKHVFKETEGWWDGQTCQTYMIHQLKTDRFMKTFHLCGGFPKKTHDKTCTTSITGTPSPGRSSRMLKKAFKEVKNWFSIPDSLSVVTSKTNTPHLIPTVLGKLPGFLVRLGTAKTCSSWKVIKKQHPCTRWFKVTLWSPIWRSFNHLKGHGSPSQKGHQQNCQV